jgi:hypothetical protein
MTSAASTPSENIPLIRRLSFTGALPRAGSNGTKEGCRHDSIFESVATVFRIASTVAARKSKCRRRIDPQNQCFFLSRIFPAMRVVALKIKTIAFLQKMPFAVSQGNF